MEYIERFILDKIHLNTLCILFCLMAVIAGFEKLGYLEKLAHIITAKAQNRRRLSIMMVMLCFFSSMFITNDVALILFVPFTISLYTSSSSAAIVFVLVMETIAANLGSMVTPIGNPQNLYLYQHYDMSLLTFVKTVGPYSLLSFVLLYGFVGFYKLKNKDFLPVEEKLDSEKISMTLPCEDQPKVFVAKTIAYSILFVLSILSVFSILPYYITFFAVLLVVGIADRKLFRRINFGLLQKFVILFLIVGNIAEIPAIYKLLSKIINGRELLCGVAFSQIMSNVPTAVMLSSFTKNGTELMLGVDIGGLGTLIASMASVITYEFYGKMQAANKGKYMMIFTLWNLIFLIFMLGLRTILNII